MKKVRKLISANIILFFITSMSVIYLLYSQKQIDILNKKIININKNTRKWMIDRDEELYSNKLKVSSMKNYENQISKLKKQVEELNGNNQVDNKREEMTFKLREEYSEAYLKDIKNLKIKLREESDLLNVFEEHINEMGLQLLPIYDYDKSNMITYRGGYSIVGKNIELIKKLKILAEDISQNTMNGLKIEINNLQVIDDKKIAVINLKEEIDINENYVYPSWSANRFLGEINGRRTEKILIESFLQRELDDEWIDGVKFLYNNTEINFDDVEELKSTIFREGNKVDLLIEDYMPIDKFIRRYLVINTGDVFEKSMIEKQGNKVCFKYVKGEIESRKIMQYSKDKIEEIFYLERYEGDNYSLDCFVQENNMDRLIIEGPIKVGASWKNEKSTNTLSVITGIIKNCETEFGSKDVLEISHINEENTVRDYYIKGIGFYKRIVDYQRMDGDTNEIKLIKVSKDMEKNDRKFSTQK